jgi:hypothetical protein
MMLAEAVEVFWPEGPLTIASLRTEIRKGRLTSARVAGRLFVTPADLKRMFVAPSFPEAPRNLRRPEASEAHEPQSQQAARGAALAALRRLK